MHIIVCIKQIIDPEIAPDDFQIDTKEKRAVRGSVALVISPFDENAIEMALQLREKEGEGKITVVTLGQEESRSSLYKALAMKVDEAVLIKSEGIGDLDSFTTASMLATAINKLAPFDLIVCGRQAGDWDAGQVGSLLAEQLNLPCTTFISKVIQQNQDRLLLQREVDTGIEIIEAPLPSIMTVTNDESNVPRIPKVRDVMRAQSKTINAWNLDDLGLCESAMANISGNRKVNIKELCIPIRDSECVFVSDEDGEGKADSLIQYLLVKKIL